MAANDLCMRTLLQSLSLLLLITVNSNAAEWTYASAPSSAEVRLLPEGDIVAKPTRTFIVTHGCGGTSAGDRFHRLAALLKSTYPSANVYRLDWSPAARATLFGIPNPLAVSQSIDPTSNSATELVRSADVDSEKLTLIGESFGVYVNHRIAQQLGVVDSMVGCNPASEAGGYVPPNLRTYAKRSCVLVTTSSFDTLRDIAEYDLILATPTNMDALQQHTFGINWLCQRLEGGDERWATMDYSLPTASTEFISGTAMVDGTIVPTPVTRPHNPRTASSEL